MYKDIIVQENVLMHLCDIILAKDRDNLQQHISFSQKLTLSKYYHEIQVPSQKSGYESVSSEVQNREILHLMLQRNKIPIKD